MKKILLVFTGGTICSSPDSEGGKNQSHAKKTGTYLEEYFKKSDSPYSGMDLFDSQYLSQDILSENMTVSTWNSLLDKFRDKTIEDKYKGVIVLHGTDTLAYTSSMLSLVLAGYKIPICMVGAQLEIKNPLTNAHTNFRTAVELIMCGIAPNVYVVYQNLKNQNHDGGEVLVHYGSHLLQCRNYSNNFHSYDEMTVEEARSAKPFETGKLYLDSVKEIKNDVLLIFPYTNMSYDSINIENAGAIVHATYHSESVCIGRAENPETEKNHSLRFDEVMQSDRPYSILSLLERCGKNGKNIPVFLAPCNEDTFKYGTTKNALDCGATGIANTTVELAYVKTLLGRSLGKSGEELKAFLKESINHEEIY